MKKKTFRLTGKIEVVEIEANNLDEAKEELLSLAEEFGVRLQYVEDVT